MKLKKEIPLVLIVLLPFLYLGLIWNKLPSKVPVHWNINGEIDRYGEKIELLLFCILLPLLTYLIFLVIPKLDPKKKLSNTSRKLNILKFSMTSIMSIVSFFIIYSSKNQNSESLNYLVLTIGLLYVIFGNFSKTIKPNYFIGIRTPWTLENEIVWKKTHKITGILWFIGGITIIISSLFLATKPNLILLLIVTAVIIVIPILYSYLVFKKETKKKYHI